MEQRTNQIDRKYLHLSDLELAEQLAKMETVLEQETGGEDLKDTLMIRHGLIEEIIFRYTNQAV